MEHPRIGVWICDCAGLVSDHLDTARVAEEAAGLEAAKSLSAAGQAITLVERNAYLGGALCQIGFLFQCESFPVRRAAEASIHAGVVGQGILDRVEMAFRAYDPCLACATHALPGQMPLQVRIHRPDGEAITWSRG